MLIAISLRWASSVTEGLANGLHSELEPSIHCQDQREVCCCSSTVDKSPVQRRAVSSCFSVTFFCKIFYFISMFLSFCLSDMFGIYLCIRGHLSSTFSSHVKCFSMISHLYLLEFLKRSVIPLMHLLRIPSQLCHHVLPSVVYAFFRGSQGGGPHQSPGATYVFWNMMKLSFQAMLVCVIGPREGRTAHCGSQAYTWCWWLECWV